jgi:hypothetical protein
MDKAERKELRREGVMMTSLGVTVWRGLVYKAGRDILQPIASEQPLGPLAGASAEVMDAGSKAAHQRSGGRRIPQSPPRCSGRWGCWPGCLAGSRSRSGS